MDDQLTPLVPVRDWIYSLYLVKFWSADPDAGGRLLRSRYCVEASPSHIRVDDSIAGPGVEWYTYAVLKEGVPAPRVIGSLYGLPMHEDGWVAGARMAEERTRRITK